MTKLLQRLAHARAQGWDGWIQSEADERAVLEGYVFDQAAAQRVRDFFRQFLRHSKGQWAGQPFELLDWQWHQVIGPLFGWKRHQALSPRLYRSAQEERQSARARYATAHAHGLDHDGRRSGGRRAR